MSGTKTPLPLAFVESSVFTRRVYSLGLEEPLRELQAYLLEVPEAGDLDPETGGLRKVRTKDESDSLTMDETLFSELIASANDALAHAQGKRDLRTTILPPPPDPMDARDVKELRARLDASQAVFASYLNVSTKLVQAWEANRRTPDGAALRLLRLAEQAPELLLSGTHPSRKRTRRAPGRPKAPRIKVR